MLATRLTVERAIAAYIAGLTYAGKSVADFGGKFEGEPASDPAHPLAVHNICGEIAEDGALPEARETLQLPALIVSSVNSAPHLIGYDICDVNLTSLTLPTELNAPAQLQLRTGWLSAVFDEARLDAITAALNPPASGPDTRPVQGLTIIGIERAGEDHSTNGRHLVDVLRLRVHASGDGLGV